MPLYREWSPTPHSLTAIWHIEEDEAFFLEKTGLISHIKHPRKRIEHLCGRYLLQYLKEDFPLHYIAPDAHDKPRIPENRYRFSISHSYPYVAAVISDEDECGIDIQIWKEGMEAVAYMFLSEAEQALCADTQVLTLAWAAKEAVYKWWGRRGVAFIHDLPIFSIAANPAFHQPEKVRELMMSMGCFAATVHPHCALEKDFAFACMVQHRRC